MSFVDKYHYICIKYMYMTSSQLQIIFNRIKKALAANHIQIALSELESMCEASDVAWGIRRDVGKLRESYGYLMKYALDGPNA